jgi:hypothetical protein
MRRHSARRLVAVLASLFIVGLALAAGASACTRPPNAIWHGSFVGPKQSGTDDAFTTLAENETFPGSEEIEFTGRTTVTGTYEGGLAENLSGTYEGIGHCGGAVDFSADLSGTIGGFHFEHIKLHYEGSVVGTEGSGTYHDFPNNEDGTWTTTRYAVAQSSGARSGEVELVEPSTTTPNALSTQPVEELPEGLVAPVGQVSYEVEGVAPGSTIDVTLNLPAGSHPIRAYKRLGTELFEYPEAKTHIGPETMMVEIEDNGIWDENPALGAIRDPVIPVASDPEFGRCVKAPAEKVGKSTIYQGKYTTSGCTARSSGATGKYEWEPGVVAKHFQTVYKPPAPIKFETPAKAKVTCTGESSSGEITGTRTVGGVKLVFTGCSSTTGACTTAGHAEGELESSELEGVLGLESVTFKSGKETRHAGLDLFPVGHTGTFLEYTCTGGSPTVLSGSVISAMPADKMFTVGTVKYAEMSGKQKPERFEGGSTEVLRNGMSLPVGLSLTATETTEEPLEINAYY